VKPIVPNEFRLEEANAVFEKIDRMELLGRVVSQVKLPPILKLMFHPVSQVNMPPPDAL
jgi:hypothetical protein